MGDHRAGALVGVLRGHRPAAADVDLQTARYFEIADDEALSYDEKIDRYLALADEHFETERYWEWCDEAPAHLPEPVHEWVTVDDFDRLLRDTVAATYPPHEQEEFLAHFRGLVGLWVEQTRRSEAVVSARRHDEPAAGGRRPAPAVAGR